MIKESLDKDVDIRDKWMGIKSLKSEYKTMPYSRKTKGGKHIHKKQRAEMAAQYLEKEQWGEDAKTETKEKEEEKEKRKGKEEEKRGRKGRREQGGKKKEKAKKREKKQEKTRKT